MRAGGEPDRAASNQILEPGQRHLIGRQRRGGEFQISNAFDIIRAETAEPVGIALGLRQAEVEIAQQTSALAASV